MTRRECGEISCVFISPGSIDAQCEEALRRWVDIFTAGDHEGEARETEEAVPLWTPVDRIPYGEMWDDDQYWLPSVLAGSRVYGRFTFTGINVVDYHIQLFPGFDPQ